MSQAIEVKTKNRLRTIKKSEVKPGDVKGLISALEALHKQRIELDFWQGHPELQFFRLCGEYEYDDSCYFWDLNNLEKIEFVSEDAKRKTLLKYELLTQQEIDEYGDEAINLDNFSYELCDLYNFVDNLDLTKDDLNDDNRIKRFRPKNLKGAIAQVNHAIEQTILSYLKGTKLSIITLGYLSHNDHKYYLCEGQELYFSQTSNGYGIPAFTSRSGINKTLKEAAEERLKLIAEDCNWELGQCDGIEIEAYLPYIETVVIQ